MSNTPPHVHPNASEKETVVQAMFSSIARFYDLNNTVLSLGIHHRWKRETVRVACLRAGERVLDIGAGTGDLSCGAAKEVGTEGRVVAIDLNAPMLRAGLKRMRAFPQVEVVRGRAEQIPVSDGQADVVLTGFCLRNVSDLDVALKEICRVLRPGGRMVCLEFSRPVSPALRRLYDFYSFTLLPKIGTWVSADQTGVYQYLPDSIRRFPDQQAFCDRILAAGFKTVTHKNLTGGIVALHVAHT
jgi:demethylmenaquinone methyltransferase/2-methoxy-6-polyprenyl-1,4-benzoquinol methylase